MMKITDLSKCKNFYCPPEVQFIELRIERGFAEKQLFRHRNLAR